MVKSAIAPSNHLMPRSVLRRLCPEDIVGTDVAASTSLTTFADVTFRRRLSGRRMSR